MFVCALEKDVLAVFETNMSVVIVIALLKLDKTCWTELVKKKLSRRKTDFGH